MTNPYFTFWRECAKNPKLEIEKLRYQAALKQENLKRKLKPILLGLSSVFILLPLIPSINLIAAFPIGCVGAVGFATALCDSFGELAFNAGRAFKNIFTFKK